MPTSLKLFYSYLGILAIGWVFLSFPIAHINTIGSIDNLFTATSAISTTGLSTTDIGQDYTFFGQLIILVLIQIGGIGYLTMTTMIALSIHHRFSKQEHDLIQSDLNLPEHYGFKDIIKIKLMLTLIVETIGAALLYYLFSQNGMEHALWQAVFHSVSAFCTAGMSLFSNNLESFNGNYGVQFVIISLSVIGSLGFIVFSDFYRMFRYKHRRLSITSKVIVVTFLIVVTVGTLLLFFAEEQLANYSVVDRFLLSLFHSLSASTTAGFNTIPLTQFFPASLFLISILMFIGASPTGTGGGLKTTTIAIALKRLISTLSNNPKVVLLGNQISSHRINLATSSILMYGFILYGGIFLLLYSEDQSFMALFFEASSALGTVGLSTGITGSLSVFGKLIIICLMFIGRITPLTIGIILFNKTEERKVLSRDDISI